MVTQSTLATRVPANIPGARIRSATNAWTSSTLPPRMKVVEAAYNFGEEGRFDWWRLTLACGHTADCGEEMIEDYWRCQECIDKYLIDEPQE